MRAKKSLGQNFLRDNKVVERVATVISPCEGETLIEIGPGEGVLTAKLADSGARVIAVELDNRLVPLLEKKFDGFDNVRIVHGDILEMNVEKLVEIKKSRVEDAAISTEESSTNEEISRKKTGDSSTLAHTNSIGVAIGRNDKCGEYRVVGNLPYYITSKIIRMFLELENPPREMFFMVQREVAERICAHSGEMSIMSVAVQYYADPEILFAVPASAFEPEPKVESAFIKIVKRKKRVENIRDTKDFFRLVKMGFAARRKTLANNMAAGLQRPKQEIEALLQKVDLGPRVRAQDLGVEEWKRLSDVVWEN